METRGPVGPRSGWWRVRDMGQKETHHLVLKLNAEILHACGRVNEFVDFKWEIEVFIFAIEINFKCVIFM